MSNLAIDLREAAQMYPDRPAIRLDGTTFSYAQLDDLSARAADWLQSRERGLVPVPTGNGFRQFNFSSS